MKNFRQILYVVLFSMLALLFFPMMVKAGPYHTNSYTLAATTPSPDSGDGATRNEKEIYIDEKPDKGDLIADAVGILFYTAIVLSYMYYFQ